MLDCICMHWESYRGCATMSDSSYSYNLLLLLRSYDHALDPESDSVDEVGGRHQVVFEP